MSKPLTPKNHNLPKLTMAGEWYRQRDEWMRALTENTDLTLAARLVGLHIALRMNRADRKVTHMQATIARQTGLGVETVRSALRQLRKAELVAAVKGDRGRSGRAMNNYELIYPWER